MSDMVKCKLHGSLKEAIGDRDDLYLIGDFDDGGITTKEQYDSFEPGFAHCFEGGIVKRYGVIIGDSSDIELLAADET